jgi:hypothetical protein
MTYFLDGFDIINSFIGKVQSAPSSSSADVVITESVRKHSDTKLFMVTSNITLVIVFYEMKYWYEFKFYTGSG